MQPLRHQRTEHRTCDPWEQHEEILEQEDAIDVLTDQDSVDSHNLKRSIATICGCVLNPPGGYCADCPPETGPVCQKCFGHCSQPSCGKPICRRHGSKRGTCNDCHEAGSRKQLTKRIVRTLLHPFVRFNNEAK